MMGRINYYYSRFGIIGVWNAIKEKLRGSDKLLKVERKGIKNPFYLRMGTSDLSTFDQIFIFNEYDFETSISPNVIIDAGANIGLASIYFANKYNGSRIIAIEPEESNFLLLQKNVASYTNIIALQAALWGENEEISLVDPGLGKWGFITEGKGVNHENDSNLCHYVKGMTVDKIMQDYHLQRIDILKIDIEGAEREVFDDTSSWIEKVDAIIIELHERQKPGCNCSFYNGSKGFGYEWRQGEKVYLSRKDFLKRSSI
jgi:FkbM family methyltransferase